MRQRPDREKVAPRFSACLVRCSFRSFAGHSPPLCGKAAPPPKKGKKKKKKKKKS